MTAIETKRNEINAAIANYKAFSARLTEMAENHEEGLLEAYNQGVAIERGLSIRIKNYITAKVGAELARNYMRRCEDVLDRINIFNEYFNY